MLKNDSLSRLKVEAWTAKRQKEEAFAEYTKAKEYVADAYVAVQGTWKKFCEAKEKVARSLDNMQRITNNGYVSPESDDAVMIFRRAQIVLEHAKIAHESAQKELKFREAELTRLQKDYELAENNYTNVLEKVKNCLTAK